MSINLSDKVQSETIYNLLKKSINNPLRNSFADVSNLDVSYPLAYLRKSLLICKQYRLLINCFELSEQNTQKLYRLNEFKKYGAYKLCSHLKLTKILKNTVNLPFGQLYNSIHCICSLEDANLAYIYELLNINDMMDGLVNLPPREVRVGVMCGIIGEVCAVIKQFKNSSNPPASILRTIQFLKEVKYALLQIILEYGRDRAAFTKSSYNSYYTESMPIKVEGPNSRNKYVFEGTYVGDVGENKELVESLLGGSLVSQFFRFQQLWSLFHNKGPISDYILERIIYRSVATAVKNMTPYRKLMFTRFLTVTVENTFAHPSKSLNLNSFLLQPLATELILIIFNAFLATGISVWYYEDDSQLKTFQITRILSDDIKNAINRIMTIKETIENIHQVNDAFVEKLRFKKSLADFNLNDIHSISVQAKR